MQFVKFVSRRLQLDLLVSSVLLGNGSESWFLASWPGCYDLKISSIAASVSELTGCFLALI